MILNLKLLRNTKGWTQMELAIVMGVSIDHIRALETGRKNPSLKLLKKIYDTFGCTSFDQVLNAS